MKSPYEPRKLNDIIRRADEQAAVRNERDKLRLEVERLKSLMCMSCQEKASDLAAAVVNNA